jgi:hypothetical protein
VDFNQFAQLIASYPSRKMEKLFTLLQKMKW